MAAITPTLNEICPVGDHCVVTGGFTGVDSDSHIALVPTTGHVLAFSVSTPSEDVTTPWVQLNKTTGGTNTQGTVRVNTATTGYYTFIAHVQGAI